jgi:hypothetical protein
MVDWEWPRKLIDGASRVAIITMTKLILTILLALGSVSLLGALAYVATDQGNNSAWTSGNFMTPQEYYALAKANPHYVITARSVTAADRGVGVADAVVGGNGGEISTDCTVIWQAVDAAHPDQGGPGGCY